MMMIRTLGLDGRCDDSITTIEHVAFMAARYGIGQAIIFFVLWFFFFLSIFFFPRLFSAIADWMSTILPHGVALVRI